MPYIANEERSAIDSHVVALADVISRSGATVTHDRAGPLNYACTTLALKLFPQRKYWILALVVGVFVTVVLEYYRRWVAPYEDQKIAENGDCYPGG